MDEVDGEDTTVRVEVTDAMDHHLIDTMDLVVDTMTGRMAMTTGQFNTTVTIRDSVDRHTRCS